MQTILTTIKLNKKTDNEQVTATKAPLRRSDAAKRDRSVAPAKNTAPATENAPSIQTAAPVAASRQRNHRFDGTLHGAEAEAQAAAHEPSAQTRQAAPRTEEKAQRARPTSKPRPASSEPQYRQSPTRGGKVRDGYEPVTSTHARAAYAKSKPVASSPEFPRLSKRMAELGLCSRREADEWIVNGWVKVDGVIIETLGTRIDPNAEIIISSYAQEQQAETVTIILHKPVGYVSGQAEDGYQPAIVLIHPDNQWPDDPELHGYHPKQFQRGFLHGLAPAGRLDIDSTGMLVLTQDGRIARHLIGEDSSVEKEYLVRVEGTLTDANMKLLNFGLSLDDVKLKPAKVSWQNEDQLRFVLREGKKRQIRRMCEMVGLQVVGLKRTRIGSVNLGKLPVGQWRYLRRDEKF
jgi:23S rRNA pseudouridine2604 synthase